MMTRAFLALALFSAAALFGAPGASWAAGADAQCLTCRDACAKGVEKCYLDMCTKNGGAEDSDQQCHDLNPKKLNDYLGGYSTCQSASAACQAKCVSDKICSP